MSVRAVILAGQRPGPDALCDYAGVSHKADIEVAGTSMLERVVAAVRAAGIPDITLSGYAGGCSALPCVGGGDGPADSALIACGTGPFPTLLTTADHPLLTESIVRDFVRGAQASGADVCVGFARETVIARAHPDTKRTYMRFSDASVSGCNLFYLDNEKGLRAIDFWRRAQHLRKKPLQLASRIGVGVTARYAIGRLSLQHAFDYAGQRIGITVAPVFLDHANAAVDVDTPSDLDLVRRLLAAS